MHGFSSDMITLQVLHAVGNFPLHCNLGSVVCIYEALLRLLENLYEFGYMSFLSVM
jgi:hypothetical protein